MLMYLPNITWTHRQNRSSRREERAARAGQADFSLFLWPEPKPEEGEDVSRYSGQDDRGKDRDGQDSRVGRTEKGRDPGSVKTACGVMSCTLPASCLVKR